MRQAVFSRIDWASNEITYRGGSLGVLRYDGRETVSVDLPPPQEAEGLSGPALLKKIESRVFLECF